MKTFATLSLVLLFLTSIANARLWKDQDGRPMEADFVSTYMKEGVKMVVFTKGDGMRYQFPLSRLSDEDQQYVAQLEANGGEDPNAADDVKPVMPKTEFEEALAKHLVKRDGSRLSRVKEADVPIKDYYAIYYSAHWCGPCRNFTPKLVDFYNDASKDYDNFEIVFFSRDRTEDGMEHYMAEYNMPWPAVDYDMLERADELSQFSGGGIPCLVLVDRHGKVLKDSYDGKKYMGPTRVMNELKRRLEEKQG